MKPFSVVGKLVDRVFKPTAGSRVVAAGEPAVPAEVGQFTKQMTSGTVLTPSISGVTVGSLCVLAIASNGTINEPSGWSKINEYTGLSGSTWALFTQTAAGTTVSATSAAAAFAAILCEVKNATSIAAISNQTMEAADTSETVLLPSGGADGFVLMIGFDRTVGSTHTFPTNWTRRYGAAADAGGFFTPLLGDIASAAAGGTQSRVSAEFQANFSTIRFS